MSAAAATMEPRARGRLRLRDPRAESLEGRRVLLIGGYGVGNLGDEAILAGLIQEHDLWGATVVSYDPAVTERLHGVRAVSPFSARFVQAFARAEHVVIGGGGMFSAYMGRFARAIPLVGLAAQRLGKRVEYRAIGAYPGTPRLAAMALGFGAQRADRVTVRDDSSVAFLRALGVRRPVERVPDPALALDPCPPARARALLAAHAPGLDGPFAAFGVRRLKDAKAHRRMELALAGVCGELRREGVQPLFVPFSRHPYEPLEDDDVYARELVAALGVGTVLEGDHHPRDVLGVLREAELVVAVRFHALVFGLRAERPVVALPYDAKCVDLLREAGLEAALPEDATVRALAAQAARALGAPRARGMPPADDGAPAPPPAAALREVRG